MTLLYTYENFIANYDLNIDYLTFFGLRRAVQKYINKTNICITTPVEMLDTPKVINLLSMNTKGTRMFYDLILENGENPGFCTKWEQILHNQVNWKKCYENI